MTATLFIALAGCAAVFMSAAMTLAFAVEQRTGNAGWVDVTWTLATGAAGVILALAALSQHDEAARALLVSAFAAIWSARLASHIAGRARRTPDDARYAAMRAEWGADAPRRMFRLLQIQAVASLPLVLAIAIAAWNGARPIGVQDYLAIAVMLAAIFGEALADRQLRAFAREPANRGRVCDTGLWAWSRHPNYFFEWLFWVAFPLFAIDLSGVYPWGWAALAAPVCMYWLLTRISGVPMLEVHMVEKYGDAYRAYQRRTNAFFPAPRRSGV